jgi:hypothetical protein
MYLLEARIPRSKDTRQMEPPCPTAQLIFPTAQLAFPRAQLTVLTAQQTLKLSIFLRARFSQTLTSKHLASIALPKKILS